MQRIYLNDNWYFARNYTEDLLNPEADLSELRKVRIPHSVCELSYSNFDEMSVQQLCGYAHEGELEEAGADYTVCTVEELYDFFKAH